LNAGTKAELKQAKKDIGRAQSVVDLLVVLLKICRRHASELLAASQDLVTREQLWTQAVRLEEEATKTFTSKGLSPQTKEFAQHTLDQASDLAVTARALALGVDMAMKSRYQRAYRTVYRQLCAQPVVRELKEDDPYPTTSVDLVPMYGPHGLSSPAGRNAGTAVDCVDGLALWPAPSEQPLRVIYDTEAGVCLDLALAQTVDIVAVLPNRDALELDFPIPDGKLFGVQAHDTALQDTIVEAALQRPAAKGADIVATPELSCTTRTVEMIKQCTVDGRPPIVIAGGSHVSIDGKRWNRLSTIYTGKKPLVRDHDKIGRYAFPVEGGMEIEEGIDRSTELRIHAGTYWSMIPLICADFLEEHVVDAVAALCPRLVVIASMSTKIGGFELSMGTVIKQSQALVVVVNGPHDWWGKYKVPVVVVGMPLETNRIRKWSPPVAATPPYQVRFSSKQRTLRSLT
jgi:hypothetical protein